MRSQTTVKKNDDLTKIRRVAIGIDLDWPYKRHTELFFGITQYAREQSDWDYRLLPIADMSAPQAKIDLPYDGIIARASAGLVHQAKQQQVPLVNVLYTTPISGTAAVVPDFCAAGRMAAEHLVARGIRHLGLIRYHGQNDALDTLSEMRQVADEHDIELLEHKVSSQSFNRSPEKWHAFQAQLIAWLESCPTPLGLLCQKDLLARYTVEACRTCGLRVPEDIAVIGAHNDLELCLSSSPSLTSIDFGFRQIGFRAAEMLDSIMDGSDLPEKSIFQKPLELIGRESTDVIAVDDPLISQTLQYIADNCDKPISVTDVTNHVPAARRSLERKFRLITGRSIGHEINRMRIERAKRLLVESDAPIKIVAIKCGFSDAGQLRRNFLQFEGINPSEFREER